MIFWARDTAAPGAVVAEVATGCLLGTGIANASSASLSVTRWLMSRECFISVGEDLSKSNFPPSCSNEN
jgi:hypothetical protein